MHTHQQSYSLTAHGNVLNALMDGLCGHLIVLEFPNLVPAIRTEKPEFFSAYKTHISNILKRWVEDEPKAGELSISYCWDDLLLVIAIDHPILNETFNSALKRLKLAVSSEFQVTYQSSGNKTHTVFLSPESPYIGTLKDRRIRSVEGLADDLIKALYINKKKVYARNKWTSSHLVKGVIDAHEGLTESELVEMDTEDDRAYHKARTTLRRSLEQNNLTVGFWPVENPNTSELIGFSYTPTLLTLQTKRQDDPTFSDCDTTDCSGQEICEMAMKFGLTNELDIAVLEQTLEHANRSLTADPLASNLRLFVPIRLTTICHDTWAESIEELLSKHKDLARRLTLIFDTNEGPNNLTELNFVQRQLGAWFTNLGVRSAMDNLASGSPMPYLRTVDGQLYWCSLPLQSGRVRGVSRNTKTPTNAQIIELRGSVVECSDHSMEAILPAGTTLEVAKAVSKGNDALLERDYSECGKPLAIGMITAHIELENERLKHNATLINAAGLFGGKSH